MHPGGKASPTITVEALPAYTLLLSTKLSSANRNCRERSSPSPAAILLTNIPPASPNAVATAKNAKVRRLFTCIALQGARILPHRNNCGFAPLLRIREPCVSRPGVSILFPRPPPRLGAPSFPCGIMPHHPRPLLFGGFPLRQPWADTSVGKTAKEEPRTGIISLSSFSAGLRASAPRSRFSTRYADWKSLESTSMSRCAEVWFRILRKI